MRNTAKQATSAQEVMDRLNANPDAWETILLLCDALLLDLSASSRSAIVETVIDRKLHR